MNFLDFEKSIAPLEGQMRELRRIADDGDEDLGITNDISRLQGRIDKKLRELYSNLTPWAKTQVARHPDRPHCLAYVAALLEKFQPLAGDRTYGEDRAVVGGLGRLRGRSVMALGLEKGHDLTTRIKHNFGMARPEGYRKAQRLMRLAERFRLPIIAFIDTAGAYPGVDAEERGQAEAIARSIETCLDVRTPLVSIVIGEGGSGGALALGVGDVTLMLEHAIYSVISPEGCASILWRSDARVQTAAEALRLTAQDLLKLKVIDGIIPEPLGGAHRDRDAAIQAVGDAVCERLDALIKVDPDTLLCQRRDRFLAMG